MMKRERAVFVSAADEYGEQSMTADVAIAEDDAPEFSGLYDARGNKLYRRRERVPVGFVKR
jgi:hypothetical protein